MPFITSLAVSLNSTLVFSDDIIRQAVAKINLQERQQHKKNNLLTLPKSLTSLLRQQQNQDPHNK
jgi:hypothetical protein